VADGRWPVADGRWPVAGGRWPVAGGRWPVAVHVLVLEHDAAAGHLDRVDVDVSVSITRGRR
jgi:hypothetical protein